MRHKHERPKTKPKKLPVDPPAWFVEFMNIDQGEQDFEEVAIFDPLLVTRLIQMVSGLRTPTAEVASRLFHDIATIVREVLKD